MERVLLIFFNNFLKKFFRSKSRHEVLFQFHKDCPSPSIGDVRRWSKLYPEFSKDIAEHAAVYLEWRKHLASLSVLNLYIFLSQESIYSRPINIINWINTKKTDSF